MPKHHPEKIRERSQGMCEANCGRAANDIHHRRPLRRGGLHNLANLIALCGYGNHDNGEWCHGRAHAGHGNEGWLISQYEKRPESELIFVDLRGVAWVFDDNGGKEEHRATS
ncbi:hypothetical protein GCM10020360_32920 [Nonlabens tegetincola]